MLVREVGAAAAERRRPPVAESESMREFWDSRAEENSLFFVDNTLDYRASDPSRFWARGEAELDSVLGPVGAELRESDRVVEIGCGVGRLTRVIASAPPASARSTSRHGCSSAPASTSAASTTSS